MASEAVVLRTLQAIANMFNKGSWWVQDSTKMWILQLEDVDDQELIQGTKDCLRKAKKLPTVANLREIIEARPGASLGQPLDREGCDACGRTGCREMARWYMSRGTLVAYSAVAACDCVKGQRLATGAFHDWRRVLAAWEADPWTAKDSEDRPIVFYGTHKDPRLSDAQKLTPDALADRQARRTAAEAAAITTGTFRRVGKPRPQ
jgi:hypothetical protein